MSPTPEEDSLEEAIKAFEHAQDGDGALVVGWVVIAEWVDKDGEPVLSAYARTGMPYWRIDGLIEAGRTAIEYDDEWDELDFENE